MGVRDKVTILKAAKYRAQNWVSQSLEMIMQAVHQYLEELFNSTLIGEAVNLNVLRKHLQRRLLTMRSDRI